MIQTHLSRQIRDATERGCYGKGECYEKGNAMKRGMLRKGGCYGKGDAMERGMLRKGLHKLCSKRSIFLIVT